MIYTWWATTAILASAAGFVGTLGALTVHAAYVRVRRAAEDRRTRRRLNRMAVVPAQRQGSIYTGGRWAA